MANSDLPPGSKGNIPVPLAKTQVQNWEDYLALETTDLIVNSFLFDLEVVKNLIADTPDANGMRVYPALKQADDPSSMTLLLVPTIDGKDIIRKSPPGGTVGGEDDDTNIYNYASACPPKCPPPGHCHPHW